MIRRMSLVALVAVVCGGLSAAWAQDKPATTVRPVWGGDSSAAITWQFDAFLRTIADLNLLPDFNLDKPQKEKIQAVRAELKAAIDKFKEDNKADLEKAHAEMQEAMKAQDQQKMRELGQQIGNAMAKGPKADEYTAKVKAVLTPDQIKAMEEKQKQQEAEHKARMEEWKKNMPARGGQ